MRCVHPPARAASLRRHHRSDLCDEAEIRRTTFYKHFADKQEFFVFYVWTVRDEFDGRIDIDPTQETGAYVAQMSRHMVAFFLEHEKLVDSAFASNLIGFLCDAFADMVRHDLRSLAFEVGTRVESPQQAELSCAYMAGGITQAMRTWWPNRAADPQGEAVLAVLATMAERIL